MAPPGPPGAADSVTHVEVDAFEGDPAMLARVTTQVGRHPITEAPLTWATLHVVTPQFGCGIDLNAERCRRMAAGLLNAADLLDGR